MKWIHRGQIANYYPAALVSGNLSCMGKYDCETSDSKGYFEHETWRQRTTPSYMNSGIKLICRMARKWPKQPQLIKEHGPEATKATLILLLFLLLLLLIFFFNFIIY